MKYETIEKAISAYVVKLLTEDKPILNRYSLEHTLYSVERVREIASRSSLSGRDLFIAVSAVWFHDVGYSFYSASKSSLFNLDTCSSFLLSYEVDQQTIQEIIACIHVATFPHQEVTGLKAIVSDSVLYYWGDRIFFYMDQLLRLELEIATGLEIENFEWIRSRIKLFEAHQFHTKYCRNLLEIQKKCNLNRLEMIYRHFKETYKLFPPFPGVEI